MTLPVDSKARKNIPLARGLLDYFPSALAAVAELSRIGNEQHQPGEPMHWAREKSTDHADCIVRHLVERGTVDSDGVRHSVKVAWRALALAQTEIEEEMKNTPAAGPLGKQYEQPVDYELPPLETAAAMVARMNGHQEGCPCFTCTNGRRALTGQWE